MPGPEDTETHDPGHGNTPLDGSGATNGRSRPGHPALQGTALAVALVGATMLVTLPGLLALQGPPMEEGFMLTFPQRVLAGDVPNVDFLHLYGPLGLWVLAAVYRVVGASLAVERTVGFIQILALVGGVMRLVRPWGRRAATIAGVTCAVFSVTSVGLTALAWPAAAAAVVWAASLLAGAGARRWPLWVGAGLCGIAVSYRPDFVLLAAAVLAVWWVRCRPAQEGGPHSGVQVAAGAALGLTPLLVHTLIAGFGPAWTGMVLEPVVRLRPGRSLPVPPSLGEPAGLFQKAGGLHTVGWPLPTLPLAKELAGWFWAVVGIICAGVALAVGSGRRLQRGRAPDPPPPAGAQPPGRTDDHLVMVALIQAGMLTHLLQRPDAAHLAAVSSVVVGLSPALVTEWFGRSAGVHPGGSARPRRTAAWVSGIGIGMLLVVIAPQYTARTWVDLAAHPFGTPVPGFAVTRGDRSIRLGDPSRAAAAQRVVDQLSSRSRAGQRLVVGTTDLRYTPYSDAVIYHLFPELVPGTRFIEMDPGIANAADSPLAEEINRADWLVLSSTWLQWDEPNRSMDPGPDLPNLVVRKRFCPVGDPGAVFVLYGRCGPSSG